ncbi:L-type lectin-domain containing receptor kinase S.4 [Cryptomeria japonica]|uniref:L-type lectin-domain containing receptor kinase S.4 n=1 Tax=Cryptomeria japonica TaxID=3369 RepID=UPI0027DA2750|nr:L-type lectin-domain containing receptor kinase S.4 [Cryptomeria japonica]
MASHLILFLLGAAVSSLASASGVEQSTSFIFNQFSGTNTIEYVEDASMQSNVIHLTNHSERAIGRAYYDKLVPMKRKGSVISFSTSFVFAIVPHPRSGGGDGLCFIMTPTTALNGAIATQYFGLVNTSSDGKDYNHLFAVEFDTIQSIGVEDKDSNHVGIDLNSVKSVVAQFAGYRVGNTLMPINLKSGHNIRAWIDYDGASKQLDIRIAAIGQARPQKALLSKKNLNLDDIIEDHMYVGFSASTGSSPLVEDHYILAWSFTTGSSKALDLDTSHLPSFYMKIPKFYDSAKFISSTTICSVAFILGLILGTFYWLRRIDYIDFYEKWEVQYWPHRFSYRELKLATKGFRDDNLLGSGGFGRVYRGTLASGEEVAVKSITKDCTEGMKEFVAEISSLGRLQHRNLVPLRGWCRKNKRLFIVYDYMSNGSLEKNLFTPEANLTWAQRYKILTGVATGLLYLHEQWEKRVVHRDIKSSNILLDHDLNGRVGDFGLARLYDHSEKPQTTHVVGTLGYIAPELIHSGKASAYTDVFSFGALMLEVACGRKPVDPCAVQGVILVQWVWDLYINKRLLDAVDERLGDDYDKREAAMVLVLGLVCSNPDPQERPCMRQILQILCGEAALPVDLHVPLALTHPYIDIADSSSSTPLLHCSSQNDAVGAIS